MQILSQMMPANEVPSSSIYPGFGPDKWPGEISTHAVTISRDARTKISEKIVRGLLFLEEGVLIDESYEIQTYTLTEEGAQPLIEAVNRWGVIHAQEPGIIVRRATVPEDQKSSLFEIEIWGQFKMYTIVHRKDA